MVFDWPRRSASAPGPADGLEPSPPDFFATHDAGTGGAPEAGSALLAAVVSAERDARPGAGFRGADCRASGRYVEQESGGRLVREFGKWRHGWRRQLSRQVFVPNYDGELH